ncbi:NEAT domain-containing protein [Bacillus sp. SL00103]
MVNIQLYVVWKADSDSTSTANTYFEKPAKLVVKDGKIKAQVTLTNSSWITSFKTLEQRCLQKCEGDQYKHRRIREQ